MMTDDRPRRIRPYVDEFTGDKRSTRVTIRATQTEKARWKEVARREGLDLSSFMRRLAELRCGAGPKRGPPSSKGSP
jgi:mobilization protein NikA